MFYGIYTLYVCKQQQQIILLYFCQQKFDIFNQLAFSFFLQLNLQKNTSDFIN